MSKRALAAIVAGVLIGGGLTAVSPAGAEVSQAAATNWKKIWKKKLQPLADKRYYTKSTSDAKYSTKAEVGAAFANYYTKAQSDAALGGYYTKAQADAKYAAAGSSYTKAEGDAKYQPAGSYAAAGSSYSKAESDAKYAPVPSLIRGTYDIIGYSNGAGAELADNLSFGWTLSAAPITHYINDGAIPPAGCSGTVSAPNASPGHLCVFEAQSNLANQRRTINATGSYNPASPFGAGVTVTTTAAGNVYVYGSWAVRPAVAVGPQGVAAVQAPAAAPGGKAGD
ncbi:hypothetical protein [Nocardioides sp. B-3]|uniref:hypothetical protein n=1 Tax=Nocardioides sp. B-3 TaxID=2895565 RepID=UPI002152DF4C|nr:hypothetical protein [Nocardioides sp. B-3]UUZ60352.1 hypothetical protein LP418_05435 [Nocardioides sp. B-3]